jgi:hypothetical protein
LGAVVCISVVTGASAITGASETVDVSVVAISSTIFLARAVGVTE